MLGRSGIALLLPAASAAMRVSLTGALGLSTMRMPIVRARHACMSSGSAGLPNLSDLTDPRIWLEDVEGEEALAWVLERNKQAINDIGEPSEKKTYDRLLDMMDSNEKIPFIGRVLNGLYYNFWQDENHAKGIWRRCTLEEYRKAEPAWELVLDVDALGEAEGVSWVWGGSTLLDEGPDVPKDRVMLRLSRGGSDATVAREFDLDKKEFVAEADGGFVLPEAKSQISYKDRDTLLVGGVFGEDEMTESGYSRTVHEWKRGTPLASAPLVYEGDRSDVSVGGFAYLDRGRSYEMRYRSLTFYTSLYELKTMPDGSFERIPVPDDATVGTFADQLLVTLRSEWLGHPAGAMLAAPVGEFMAAADDEARKATLQILFGPTETASLEASTETRNYLILSVLDDVVTELRFFRYDEPQRAWNLERSFREEGLASPSASAVDAEVGDSIWMTSSGYTQPTTLSIADAAAPQEQERLKSLPAFFDASGITTTQHFATSADGARVPYFLVCKEDLPLDGTTPTLLYGYGGFEISLTPGYSGGVGAAWLEKGYAYAVANIRGGGEYGPRWHQSALKEKRRKAYEDFEAIAKDLCARGVTSAPKLGCQGGSNGGLLTGNMLVRSPELFGAIVCQVPLLDMHRFHTLLAGASWMGEYGNPEEEWEAFLSQYSPYHNIEPGTSYPPILFTTSTRDDRVHPGHARKMVGKLIEMGNGETYYYENMEGGHGGAADNKQRAFMSTLAYDFLEQQLVNGRLSGGAPTKAGAYEYEPSQAIY
jgi:prolyl oligopeptidase